MILEGWSANLTAAEAETLVSRSHTIVQIYYSASTQTEFVVKEAVPLHHALAVLGCFLQLFLGASAVSGVELMEGTTVSKETYYSVKRDLLQGASAVSGVELMQGYINTIVLYIVL